MKISKGMWVLVVIVASIAVFGMVLTVYQSDWFSSGDTLEDEVVCPPSRSLEYVFQGSWKSDLRVCTFIVDREYTGNTINGVPVRLMKSRYVNNICSLNFPGEERMSFVWNGRKPKAVCVPRNSVSQ